MTLSEIEVREVPGQDTAVVRTRLTMSETDRIGSLLEQSYAAVQRTGQEPAGMPYLRTLSMDMASGAMEIEVGWPVASPFPGDGEVVASALPSGRAAAVTYTGPYEGIPPAYEALQRWCAEQGLAIAGGPWECYFTDPTEEPDSSKWRTDIFFPLA